MSEANGMNGGLHVVAVPAGADIVEVLDKDAVDRALEAHARDFEDEPTVPAGVNVNDDDICGGLCASVHAYAERIEGSARLLELMAAQRGVDQLEALRVEPGPPPTRGGA